MHDTLRRRIRRLYIPLTVPLFPFTVLRFPARWPWVIASREGAKRYEAQAFPICGGETPADSGEPPFSRGRAGDGIARGQAREPQKERTSRIQAEHPVRLRRTRHDKKH